MNRDDEKPYLRLCASVIFQALQDHHSNLLAKFVSPHERVSYAANMEPARWLKDKSNAAFSCRWLCTILDIDHDAFAEKINQRDLIPKMKAWASGDYWDDELRCSGTKSREIRRKQPGNDGG